MQRVGTSTGTVHQAADYMTLALHCHCSVVRRYKIGRVLVSGNSAGLGNTTSTVELGQAGKDEDRISQLKSEDVSLSGGDTTLISFVKWTIY